MRDQAISGHSPIAVAVTPSMSPRRWSNQLETIFAIMGEAQVAPVVFQQE